MNMQHSPANLICFSMRTMSIQLTLLRHKCKMRGSHHVQPSRPSVVENGGHHVQEMPPFAEYVSAGHCATTHWSQPQKESNTAIAITPF
eukprot:4147537-Amphidinium_carterae.2